MKKLGTSCIAVFAACSLTFGVVGQAQAAEGPDATDIGLEILGDFTDATGIQPVEGGATNTAAISDTTNTGLVVSLPATADGIAWMDDPYGYDLGLGMPTSGTRTERYCPTGGWYLQDTTCLKRLAFQYKYAPYEYDYADYEYDYQDYTHQEREYEYEYRAPDTHTESETIEEWSDVAEQHGLPCEEGEPESWAQWVNGGQGGPVYNHGGYITRNVETVVTDDPPAGSGWEWASDGSNRYERTLPVPAGWFDSGYNWQKRDVTPEGWEDVDGEWRKLIELDSEWQNTGTLWRNLIEMDGWTMTARGWRHLQDTPSGYVVDDLSWVTTIPSRVRNVGADLPPSPDTSTMFTINGNTSTEADWDTVGDSAVIGGERESDIASGVRADVQGDGTVIYDSGNDSGSVSGQVLNDGSLRLAVTIPDELAPRSFDIALRTGDFMAPALQPDGRVLVMRLLQNDDLDTVDVEEEIWETVYEVAAPWAKDANGRDVKTWYSLEGKTLTQHIEPSAGTVFPVVADPTAKQKPGAAKAQSKAVGNQVAVAQASKAAKSAKTQVSTAASREIAARKTQTRVEGVATKKASALALANLKSVNANTAKNSAVARAERLAKEAGEAKTPSAKANKTKAAKQAAAESRAAIKAAGEAAGKVKSAEKERADADADVAAARDDVVAKNTSTKLAVKNKATRDSVASSRASVAAKSVIDRFTSARKNKPAVTPRANSVTKTDLKLPVRPTTFSYNNVPVSPSSNVNKSYSYKYDMPIDTKGIKVSPTEATAATTQHFDEIFPFRCKLLKNGKETGKVGASIKTGDECNLTPSKPETVILKLASVASSIPSTPTGNIKVVSITPTSIQFESGDNHLEGEGRQIKFSFYQETIPGYEKGLRLKVEAWGPAGGVTSTAATAALAQIFMVRDVWTEQLPDNVTDYFDGSNGGKSW